MRKLIRLLQVGCVIALIGMWQSATAAGPSCSFCATGCPSDLSGWCALQGCIDGGGEQCWQERCWGDDFEYRIDC